MKYVGDNIAWNGGHVNASGTQYEQRRRTGDNLTNIIEE